MVNDVLAEKTSSWTQEKNIPSLPTSLSTIRFGTEEVPIVQM